MEIKSGIIVSVEKYQECHRFYLDKLRLPVLMEKPGIAQFAFGSMYLQLEDAKLLGLKQTRNIIIRKNEASISQVQRELESNGVSLEVHDLEWGEIGIVYDPDGNKIEYFRKK
jgi:lactoylglutathione lyase